MLEEPIAYQDDHGLRAVVEQGTVEALVDLARQGQEQDFRDLATMSGVPAGEVDALWQGTRRRVVKS